VKNKIARRYKKKRWIELLENRFRNWIWKLDLESRFGKIELERQQTKNFNKQQQQKRSFDQGVL